MHKNRFNIMAAGGSDNDGEAKVLSDIRVNLLGNEDLADAYLESTLDNVRVPASGSCSTRSAQLRVQKPLVWRLLRDD